MERGRAVNGAGTQPGQRPDGRWEGRVRIGIDSGTGKTISKSVYAKTAAESAKKLSKLTTTVNEGEYSEPSKRTMVQWLGIWCDEYLGGVKESAKASYSGYIEKHLKSRIGAVKLISLNAHTIQKMYNGLLKSLKSPDGLSAKSVKISMAYCIKR